MNILPLFYSVESSSYLKNTIQIPFLQQIHNTRPESIY